MPPSGEANNGRNCLLRASLLRGHRRLPEPPDKRTNCVYIIFILNYLILNIIKAPATPIYIILLFFKFFKLAASINTDKIGIKKTR